MYPKDLSDSASTYLTSPTSQNTDSLHSAISDNTDLVIDPANSTESGLYMTSGATDDTFARLNGIRGLKFDNSSSGTGMIQISLDGSKLNNKSFGKVLDINLRSIKGFPNFIIDWYHRQLDEIVSSLGHLPDIKIMLPDLTSLGDSGAISSFASGMKDTASNIFSVSSNTSKTASTAGTTSDTTATSTTS